MGRNAQGEFIFPSAKTGGEMNEKALVRVLKPIAPDKTVHGFRSTFSDWAGELTQYPRDMREFALAHKIADATEAAYRRGDALEKRREMMQAWADYLAA